MSSGHDAGEVQHDCSWQSLQPALPETLSHSFSAISSARRLLLGDLFSISLISSDFSQFKRCHQGSVGEIQIGRKASFEDKKPRVVSSHLKQKRLAQRRS